MIVTEKEASTALVPFEKPDEPVGHDNNMDLISDFDLMEYVANLEEQENNIQTSTQTATDGKQEISTTMTKSIQKNNTLKPKCTYFSKLSHLTDHH